MDRTTRSRLVAAGTVSLAGLLLLGACDGSNGGGGAASTSAVDSTAFRTIPVTAPPTTPAPVPAESSPAGGGDPGTGSQQGTQGGTTYTVVAGDYFFGIADKLGVDAETLAAYNDMTLSSNLVPGMTLRVPPSETSAGAGSGASDGASGGADTTQAANDGSFYVVVANDFWPQIANKLGVEVEDLLAANNATMETAIHPGQRLKIPS